LLEASRGEMSDSDTNGGLKGIRIERAQTASPVVWSPGHSPGMRPRCSVILGSPRSRQTARNAASVPPHLRPSAANSRQYRQRESLPAGARPALRSSGRPAKRCSTNSMMEIGGTRAASALRIPHPSAAIARSVSWSSSALASLRSAVSNPSVNQPRIGASRAAASCGRRCC